MPRPLQRPQVQQQKQKRQGNDHRFRHQSQREQTQCQSVADGSAPLCILQPRPERAEPEKCAENVFSLCDPGYRFNMQRVQSEYQSNECAGPEFSRRPAQKYIENQARQGMENYIFGVIPARSDSEQMVVEKQRQACYRKPVVRAEG